MSRRALIIFVRRPELGLVKTRIAAEVGDELALSVYTELLRHTRNVAEQVDCDRLLFYTDEVVTDDEWSHELFNKHIQVEGDLGQRMMSAFETALRDHEQVIIIGSDCAQLSADIIVDAFSTLDDHDAVIGPTYDGGYYLLGLKSMEPTIFQNMVWSTDTVCAETINRLQKANKDCAKISTLSDIDHWSDWEKYGWELPSV